MLQYHKYSIRVDGSGRLTTRNRRYLRRYDPFPTEPDHPQRRELPLVHYSSPVAAAVPPITQTTATNLPTTGNSQTTTPGILTASPQPIMTPPLSVPLTQPPPQPPVPPTAPTAQPSPRPPLLATPPTLRSYASVAKAPPRLTRPTSTASTTLDRIPPFTLPPTPAQAPRRSKRGPKPIDRYGQ